MKLLYFLFAYRSAKGAAETIATLFAATAKVIAISIDVSKLAC